MADSQSGSSNTASSSALRDRVRALQLPREQPTATANYNWLVIVALLALAIGGGWYWLKNKGTGESAAPPSASNDKAADQPTTPVLPTASAPAPGTLALESKGYIIPAHRILVSPKVNGMLTSLNIEEGVRVQKGAILGTIESIEYEADVKRAQATLNLAEQRALELENGTRPEEIEQARAELDETKAKLKQLDADFGRAERLVKIGGVTEAEFDEVSASRVAQLRRIDRLALVLKLLEDGPRVERIAQAKAEVEQVRAELTKAQWRLDNCTIRAPISGTILKKNAEEGNIVNPIAFNGSYSLCDMADLSDLEVDLNIQERDVARVFQGQKCKVRAEAYPDRIYEGVVSRLMPIADRAKGAVPVRVKLTVPADEEGVYLKPDMGAIVSFYARETVATKPAADVVKAEK
ncbi:MAG TPA: efflux RND transporter periplasmic adaptor subunit [Pirellulaceae bacterium]|nr:efflux RND transporter periplasmic adaptor subunit [Pirellulaceae bacterium]